MTHPAIQYEKLFVSMRKGAMQISIKIGSLKKLIKKDQIFYYELLLDLRIECM